MQPQMRIYERTQQLNVLHILWPKYEKVRAKIRVEANVAAIHVEIIILYFFYFFCCCSLTGPVRVAIAFSRQAYSPFNVHQPSVGFHIEFVFRLSACAPCHRLWSPPMMFNFAYLFCCLRHVHVCPIIRCSKIFNDACVVRLRQTKKEKEKKMLRFVAKWTDDKFDIIFAVVGSVARENTRHTCRVIRTAVRMARVSSHAILAVHKAHSCTL